MARNPDLGEFKYRKGVLIRSALTSWRPGKWELGRGASATVTPGPPNGFLASPMFLTVVTPAGEVLVIEACGNRAAARAHRLAAEINADAARAAI